MSGRRLSIYLDRLSCLSRMSSSFQSITFALLLLILRGFCTAVTHACSPPLQAPGLLSLSSGNASSWSCLVAAPKTLFWPKSTHPAFLPGACTPLPSLGASSSPGRVPELPPLTSRRSCGPLQASIVLYQASCHLQPPAPPS